MWPFRILPVLIVLITAGVADAFPARVTGDWSYDIITGDGRHRNSGGFQGIGELLIGGDPFTPNAIVFFDITTAGVRVSTFLESAEPGMPCMSTRGFSIIDRTAAAIVGEGLGCTSTPGPGDESASFFVSGTGHAFVAGDTSLIQSATGGISGFAVRLVPEPTVSEPTDFGLLAFSACLVALYCFKRRQLS
jgi:hypothetical protein